MEYLFELEMTEKEIKNMVEINKDILDLNREEIKELVNILINIGCKEHHIKNIITANPYYLSRSTSDVRKLIAKLLSLNITHLEITFDSNPWILNRDDFEIDEYIKGRETLGINIDEIIDEIDSGMLVI